VVAQNRRLAHELARQGAGEWDVTAAAPARLPGDLRSIELEPILDEACGLVPLDVHFGSYPHFRTYGGLRALLDREWDLVHCWEEPYVLAAAQIASHTKAGTRFVPATFQNIAKRYPIPIAMLERRVMDRADGWVAFGRTIYDTQHERPGYTGKPARILNPGVDVDVFRPDPVARERTRHGLGWTPEDIVAGFTGRFVVEKGIETLLDAFVHSTSHWKLLFVGDGVLAPKIESLRLAYPSRIRIVRAVAHDAVPTYLRAMDILCAPSQTTARWQEQFGRMLIEAMACGVPVVAAASGEIPYVVQDTGCLVPADDVAAWIEAIDRLAVNPSIRAELTARARTEFSWGTVARRHLEFFDEVLAQ
jgi:glycosyltransferase involved in cell wall biosynthesis